jgi:hypothetical protein
MPVKPVPHEGVQDASPKRETTCLYVLRHHYVSFTGQFFLLSRLFDAPCTLTMGAESCGMFEAFVASDAQSLRAQI